jgi:tetratricopeptide (TPR) repeat protein
MDNCRRFLILIAFMCAAAAAQLPESARARIAEAMRLASSGDLGRAENLLIELKKAHPADAEIRYRLGLVLLRQRKFAPAEAELETSAKLKPDSALAWLGLAQARLQSGRRQQALDAAARAEAHAGAEPSVRRALSMLYAQAEEFSKAAAQEALWWRAMPDDRESPLRAVEFYIRAGQADPALAIAQEALKRGDNAALRNWSGKAYRLKKNPSQAVEQFQLAISLDPSKPAYYMDLASLFLDHRTPEPAAAVLETAAARFPRNAELRRMLGLARYAMGDSQKALDAFLEAIDLAPDSEAMYGSLETLLPEAGSRLDAILVRLRSFSQKKPSSPVSYYLLAQALLQKPGSEEESEALLRKAAAADPSFWPAYFELHKPLLGRDQLAEAAEALEKVCALNPAHAPSHYSLSQIYARLGDRERSRKHREIHHKLITAQREAAEARRAESPRLPYTLRKP